MVGGNPSSCRSTLTSVALSAFCDPQVDMKIGSKDLWRCWLKDRKKPFSPVKTGQQSKMVCWATGEIDLCVTVSFYEEAKVFWHKTHDIYSQKCGINCCHPDFFKWEQILGFGYNSPEPQSLSGVGLPCHVKGPTGNSGGSREGIPWKCPAQGSLWMRGVHLHLCGSHIYVLIQRSIYISLLPRK